MARPKTFNQDVVLDKAVNLFWRQGYEATSVQDIVDHLGLSRSSLYDTFGDKHRLFVQALDRYQAREGAALTQPFQQCRGRTAIEQFFQALLARGTNPDSPPGCLMVNSMVELATQDQAIAERAEANRRELEAVFEAAIMAGQQADEIGAEHDPQLLARLLVNTMYGLQVTAKICPDRQVLEDTVAAALKQLD